ncbi:10813_t:CDS:2 [Paraglomus brasilianum]|uniref:10813_t:CDS:1 n=1 Tax=Paraglomus brasilianum TaxID=144538 RepID=A0A9N8YYP7_9GLOM|nr:10813_t:CDS:2 [Paraglomus brasilianum]
MAVTKESLEEVLKEKLSADYVIATDTSVFEGKTLLQKHQMVNNAAKAEIATLHAFSQVNNIPTHTIVSYLVSHTHPSLPPEFKKTYTPAQWEKQNKTS